MKKLIALMLLLSWGSAHAATTTVIDFLPGTYSITNSDLPCDPWCGNGELSTQSFVFDMPAVWAVSADRLLVCAVYAYCFDSGPFAQTTFRHEAGALFALQSLELGNFTGTPECRDIGEGCLNELLELTGWRDGIAVAGMFFETTDDLQEITFSSEWSNLTSVEIGVLGISGDPQDSSSVIQLSNVTVSVVPIPAAVWLFGSGLGLLGWFRRKA